MSQIVLTAQKLSVGYRAGRGAPKVVLCDLTLQLERGTLVCLIGQNGAGKSTLMRTLAAVQKPLSGKVYIGAEDVHQLPISRLARLISVVLTERAQTSLLSAYEVVSLGRLPYTDWTGRLSEADRAVVDWALEAVGATALTERPISELSDGERQKVMIGRALAQETPLIFLDEPTAFLDLPRRVEIMALLRRLAHQTGRAVLLSTHDLDLALRSADRIWLLDNDGKLHAGAPEDLVLSGAFARTFASSGVAFDAHSGTFKLCTEIRGALCVHGTGLRALWAQRALERAGFIVAEGAAETIEVSEAAWLWRGVRYESLERLIAALRDESADLS
ncbi:MAG: ABC transporter ATP-binding protein [Candidatus Thermofonsia Clade 1 bacterium]|uniref:ABC transporter ATP-binding protein n=1 Tax=Candidatus Thermofonsia Clade 1 bacterium TaxID=2364210 RepID=A0A2M8P0U2_9CHLR|nr:MAG: ABC transporter ATP-binding protein [Candidatus Thermofonsia Clade 1 bacterium]